MKQKALLLAAAFGAALTASTRGADTVVYQTGFESPTFTEGAPLDAIDGWISRLAPTAEAVISTDGVQAGAQSLRLRGVGNTAIRSILAETAAAPPAKLEFSVDVRLDGPQTGTLGTPDQDILSANFGAEVQLENGNFLLLGGFFVSSAGKIWNYVPRGPSSLPDTYKYEVTAPLGSYHHLALRVDFLSRTVTYVVDGVELGSTVFHPFANTTDRISDGFLQLNGPSNPINTPDLTYHPTNYTAYFDNYKVVALDLTQAETDVRFAKTDYAGSEASGKVDVAIQRRGYVNDAVSVRVRSDGGTATAGVDYRRVDAQVNFAPGEREKVVSIHLRDDRAVEADETVTLSLSAITPGLPVSRASAPLWILDDERTGTPETNYQFEYGALGIEELGEITSILPVSGGRFLAQVIGTDINGELIGVVARFKGDGSFDPEFEPYPLPPTGGPTQLFRLNGGNRVLANLGGRLVRLDGDGHEDPEFQVTVAGGYEFISDVVVQANQDILIAGFFESVNGVARPSVARLRSNGQVDATFNPTAGPDDLIWRMARQADGKVVVIGWFHIFGDQPRSRLARLNADGSLDLGFDPGVAFGEEFNGLPGIPDVTTLAIQPNGRILVGGFFDRYQGVTRNSLVGIRPTGELDPSFDVGTGIASSGYSPLPQAIYPGRVANLVLQPDGKVVIAGTFLRVNGQVAPGVTRLNANGSLDASFKLGGVASFGIPPSGFIPPVVGQGLALLKDGDILVGMTQFQLGIKNDPVSYSGVVRLNGAPCKQERDSDK